MIAMPSTRRLRYLAEHAAMVAAFRLLRLLPPDAASWAMGKAWRGMAPFNSRHQRALANIERALPELAPADRERVIRDMWENLGRIAAETLQLDRILADTGRFDFDIDAARDAVGERGAVVVSMHSGNWEITAMGARAAGWKTAGVYQALKNPMTDEILRDLRSPLYPGGLFSKGHETARRLLVLARSGARVAMLADLQDRRGAVIPFFGREAYATLYPATIARAADVPLVACRVVRLPANRFRIEARLVDMPRTDDRKADALEATRRYHALFEQWIREHPAQWMWIMRKWV